MDIEQIRAKLYEDFDAEGIVTRQEKAKQAQPAPPEPVDIYQRNQDRIYEVSKKSFPKGSSAVVNTAVYSVIDGAGSEGLARAYKRAKEDMASLSERGERGRAELVRQRYMQENFLPAVEIVVNSASPDDLLANEKALKMLDKHALLAGSGQGYTASYVRQAYGGQLGNREGHSDSSVKSELMRINNLLDEGEIRTAYGLTSKLKEKIDRGEAIADDIDYDLIGRIMSYSP